MKGPHVVEAQARRTEELLSEFLAIFDNRFELSGPRLIKCPFDQITRLAVLNLVSNRQRVLKVTNEFAARGSLIGHDPSFDINMIPASSDWITHSSGASMTRSVRSQQLLAVSRYRCMLSLVSGYPECQRCWDGQSAEWLTPCLQ